MTKYRSLIIIALVAVATGAAGWKFFSGQEVSYIDVHSYLNWYKAHPIVKSKEVGKYRFELSYMPPEYMVLNEASNLAREINNRKAFDSLRNTYSGMQYYILKVSLKEGGNQDFLKQTARSEQEYYNRLNYFISNLQSDLYLIEDNKDTIDCALYHFERNYSINNDNKMIIGFPVSNESGKDKTFIYKDKWLDIGTLNILIEKEEFSRLPKIQFDDDEK